MSTPTDHHAELIAGSDRACINCGASLGVEQKFCGQCGQAAPTYRLTVHDLVHDLIHAFFHVDRSILSLIRSLIVRPGVVAREYIQGKRKRYFGPFVFLIVMVGVSAVLISATNFMVYAGGDAQKGREAIVFVQRHSNWVILLQVPILAAMLALLFRSARLHYAEHLVFAAYLSGIRTLLVMLVLLPLRYLLPESVPMLAVIYAVMLLWCFYFAWAATQFYEASRGVSFAKALFAAIITQALTYLIIATGIYLYYVLRAMLLR
jgi:hypothetical protein